MMGEVVGGEEGSGLNDGGGCGWGGRFWVE